MTSMIPAEPISAQMNRAPEPQEILHAWSPPMVLLAALVAMSILYLLGWRAARVTRARELPKWRAVCWLAGVFMLGIAVASPLDGLDDYLLSAHMIQHFLLMSVAPPLIVLGAPLVPLLRGLPRIVIRCLRPLFRARWLRAVCRALVHPAGAWILMNVAYLGWHVPAMFELTLRFEGIHQIEHVAFLLTSLLFWWVVLEPWPARPRWPRRAMVLYLLSADLMNTVLSATLAFSGRVLYPSYARAPRVWILTPLQDQVAAGAEMWVLNSLVFLIPAVVIAVRELSPKFLVEAQ